MSNKFYHPELSNISENATLGDGCIIHSHVWIGDDVIIGNRVRIQAFTFIPTGVIIEDDVFIGPRVTFTNDKYPPSMTDGWDNTFVEVGVSIGAGAIILPGVTLYKGSMIGAGAVVTKDVGPLETVVGNPARAI